MPVRYFRKAYPRFRIINKTGAVPRAMPGSCDRSRKAAVARSISPSYDSALTGFFGTRQPSRNEAEGSHAAYIAALSAHGTEVTVLPALEEHPDCCFTEDTAVIVGDMAVIPNMGHPTREGEQEAVVEHLSERYEISRMPEGAKLDGGDVVFYDDMYLIGISTRTSKDGAEHLASKVREAGYNAQLIPVPSSTLHLTTVMSSPRPGTIIAAEGHFTKELLRPLADELLWVPNRETYAANTIGYSNDRAIISAGFPVTREVMLDAGFSITSVDMDPIMQADGSLTCLSVFTE